MARRPYCKIHGCGQYRWGMSSNGMCFDHDAAHEAAKEKEFLDDPRRVLGAELAEAVTVSDLGDFIGTHLLTA